MKNKTKENAILNVDNFMHKLKVDNLYSDELEKFIEDYRRYDNNE